MAQLNKRENPVASQVELEFDRAPRADELPTGLIIVLVYSLWLTLTYFFNDLSIFLSVPAAALIICWHGSIQHEIIHGHPTRNQRFNDALGFPALGLVYPYQLYKSSHLKHHRVAQLTDPIEDPESFYLTEGKWRRLNPFLKLVFKANNTLLVRLALGPAICIFGFYLSEVARILKGDLKNLSVWAGHALVVSAILFWVVGVCGISPVTYFLCFVYPGLGLTLLRSFAEHRPGRDNSEKSVIVEAALPFQLLFLNNNYHWVHHRYPGLVWYRIKDVYFANKEVVLDANNGYFFKGYGAIAKQYLLSEKDFPVHPVETVS